MSSKKITRRKLPTRQSAPKVPRVPGPPQAQVEGSLNALTPEEVAFIEADQDLMQKLGLRIAKAFLGPNAPWTRGAEIVDELVTASTEEIMKRFRGLLGLADLVAVFGSIVGYQAAINVVKGAKPPLNPGQFNEAKGLFKAAMQLNYTSTLAQGDKKVQVVKKMPKVH